LVDWVDVSTPTTSGPSAADIGLSLFRGSRDLTWRSGLLFSVRPGAGDPAVTPFEDILSLLRDASAY
jgi:hypothetical protein